MRRREPRAEFRTRHKRTKKAMREADKAAAIAAAHARIAAGQPVSRAAPNSTGEAARRLRRMEKRKEKP